MTLHVRFATADDVPLIADFIQMAGAGVFEQLLNGVLPRIKAADILPLAVTEETSPLYFDNAVLAWEGGRTLGCMVGYPAVEYGLPPVIRTMVPKRRLAPLRELLESRLDDTFYVNTLAVSEEARGRGIDTLSYFQVDNWCVKIADPYFIGYHLLRDGEMSSKIKRKTDPYESSGVFCRCNGKAGVIEYTELDIYPQLLETDEHGDLIHFAANAAIHILSVDSI